MGIFSKQTVICARCGKEYQARLVGEGWICNECFRLEEQKKADVNGYIEYAKKIKMPKYSYEQLDEIVLHRNSILEKYRDHSGITREELQTISDNYKKISDEQAADTLYRIANSTISTTLGAASTGLFFLPTGFEKIVVDIVDVFAVGYTSDHRLKFDGKEVILCAVFTNDPYIPVFPIIYTGKLGFFDVLKSKRGREGVAAQFELSCPNLTYPVQDLKQLNKMINSEGVVQGNISKEHMLKAISDAIHGVGLFNTKDFRSELSFATANMLNEYGFIQETEINHILKMDKMFNRNYWNKQMARINRL